VPNRDDLPADAATATARVLPAHLRELIPVEAPCDTAIYGYLSILDALNGNYQRLAKRLRRAVPLRQDEREFLADLMEGKYKRPKHRTRRSETAARRKDIAYAVLMREHMGCRRREAAVAEVASLFQVSRRHVFDCLAEIESDPERASVANTTCSYFADMANGNTSPLDLNAPTNLAFSLPLPLRYRSAKK
jgi:hypothetical protein